MSIILTPIVFILILSILVCIHEAGHYFVAKIFGIKVEEAGFGLPPRLWGKKIGETIYSINWLPIGGFVKLYGEDEAGAGRIELPKAHQQKLTKDEKRAYYSRSIGQRAAVVVAGVVMNTILAIAIFYVFMFLSGFKQELALIGNPHFFYVNHITNSSIVTSDIAKNSPAAKAGMTAFTKIISVNGERIKNIDRFISVIKENKGKEITVEWQDVKTNKTFKGSMTPRVNPPKNEGSLGVVFYPVETVTLSYTTPMQKALSGIVHPANLMVYQYDVLKDMIGLSIKEKNVDSLSKSVSGPVGIYALVGTIVNIPDAKERILQLLNLAGLLSISLAFFNVLPIPGLDGGRLFFIIVEAVMGRKVNQKFEGYAHAIGMALLIGLIIVITFKDVSQFFIK